MDGVATTAETGLGFVPFLGLGLGACFGVALVLYNLIVLISVLREASDEKPSAVSLIAWALGFVAVFLGPCGLLLAVIAIGLSRFEQGRIFSDQSTMRSTRPCEMATINGLLAIVSTVLFTLVTIASFMA
jgi:hypothetical protein